MKTILRLALGSVLVGAALTATAATTDLYVKYKPNASTSLLNAAIGAKVVASFPQIGWQIVRLPTNVNRDRGVRYFRSLSSVAKVEPPAVGKSLVVPNDPLYGPTVGNFFRQYHHQQIGMPGAWELSLGSPSVTVAIIDTGIRRTHEDLVNQVRSDSMNMEEGKDPNNLTDNDGHGTHVAGLAGATANNGKGGAGTGWNVRILALKTGDTGVPADAVVRSIMYAADKKVQVINMSFLFRERIGMIDDALKYAHDQDCVLIAGAGNDNGLPTGSPQLAANVLTVGSTDQGGGKSGFSNFGPGVEVAAPGGQIVSTAISGDSNYIVSSGTSMASPVVAGAAALMRAYAPELPNTAITEAIQNTAVQGADRFTVYGQVNISAAIRALARPVVNDLNPSFAGVVANEGTIVNGTGSTATDASYLMNTDNSALEIRSNYQAGLGTVAGMTTDFAVSTPPARVITARLRTSLSAGSGVTALVMLQNASTGAYDLMTSARLTTTNSHLDIPLPRALFLKYLKSNGTVRVMVRTINPSRLSPGGVPFRARFDSVSLVVTANTR